MSGESRMSKILRRLAGKDEENQEPTKEEKEMPEHKDTGKKDLDFDLGDIAGDVATDPGTTSTTPKERPFDKLRKTSPLDPLKKKVDDHLEDSWICFIEDGKFEHRELRNCTAEEFGKWLCWVYPPAASFLEKNLRVYDDYEKRKKEFMNLIGFLTKLPSIFRKYGEEKVFPRSEKTKEDKKVGGKNE